jgi:hypothetical protein
VRSPKRHREQPRDRATPKPGLDMHELSKTAKYVYSAEHKDHFGPAGVRRLRTDATPCPRGLEEETVTQWLRAAMAAGDVGGLWEDETYPQLVWKRVGEIVYEARVSNRDQGWYHGYPLDRTEWPKWLS